MMSRILIGACGLVLLTSAVVVAAPGERGDRAARLEKMLDRLDTDQSGTVSFEEFASRGNNLFAKHDADGDGLITAEEREAAKTERAEKMKKRQAAVKQRGQAQLEEIDTNADGAISRAEHDAHQRARFTALDQDGDGEVSKAEFAEEMKARREAFKAKRG